MEDRFEQSLHIAATPQTVWETLTTTALMLQWMGGAELQLEVCTDWKVGAPFIIRGRHHIPFENKGMLLRYEPGQRLQYTQMSSFSRLDDRPENYSRFDFQLTAAPGQTLLSLHISGFPTETIGKHLAFYWRGTLHQIRKIAEQQERDKTAAGKEADPAS